MERHQVPLLNAMRRVLGLILWSILLLGAFLITSGIGALGYFHFAPPEKSCLSCHEIRPAFERWARSTHRQVHCKACHGASLTLDFHALQENVRRAIGHFSSRRHEELRLSEAQVIEMNARCRICHQSEYAGWASSRHSATFRRIFLNESQNRAEQLHADCLRCHGMFFQGRIEDLICPLDTTGPWQLKDPERANLPVIPCLACHQIHVAAQGESAGRSSTQPASRPAAVSFHDRAEKAWVPAHLLPAPVIQSGGRLLRSSPDVRQRICYQCHAPDAWHQAGSSDDRTPRGVHEGVGCLACHRAHSQDTRDSCANCHPAISNCGLDVTGMDTTYRSADSAHDVHSIECGDCHAGRRPGRGP